MVQAEQLSMDCMFTNFTTLSYLADDANNLRHIHTGLILPKEVGCFVCGVSWLADSGQRNSPKYPAKVEVLR